MAEAHIVYDRKLHLVAGRADLARIAQNVGATGASPVAIKEEYDRRTRHMAGFDIPVRVVVHDDRSFELEVLAPSAASLLLELVGEPRGSGSPHAAKVGRVRLTQLRDVARRKLAELNTDDLDAATRTVAGTARSMGIDVVDDTGAPA